MRLVVQCTWDTFLHGTCSTAGRFSRLAFLIPCHAPERPHFLNWVDDNHCCFLYYRLFAIYLPGLSSLTPNILVVFIISASFSLHNVSQVRAPTVHVGSDSKTSRGYQNQRRKLPRQTTHASTPRTYLNVNALITGERTAGSIGS